ncbi:hypothetical protein [Mucilaginibacter lappiensis]|uniref:hypothetical protein n=1 Tax=Mucilaginibacter lappiensis TaxID=354630 RepID=UPI003D1A71B8
MKMYHLKEKIKTKMKKVNEYPRISVNPLCEYVDEATASRRNSIIRQCKTPVSFITKWYNRAEDSLSSYLTNVRDEPAFLSIEADRMRNVIPFDVMEKKYAVASSDALKSFLKYELEVRHKLSSFKPEIAVHNPNHKFILSGVQISLRPELILRDENGKQQLGFVKFYFGKNEPLGKDRGESMACLTKHYFENEFGFNFKSEHCMVLDVYRGEIFTSPRAYKRILANIEAACKEIADRWDKVIV